jgi:hypothetical protein
VVDYPSIDEFHRCRPRDRLRDRGDSKERLVGDDRFALAAEHVSVSLGEGDLAVVDDRYRCTADVVFVEPRLHYPIDERFEVAEVLGSSAVVAGQCGSRAARSTAGGGCDTGSTRSCEEPAA